MFKAKCILFDLDGTLIDTTPLIVESFKYTFFHHFSETKEEAEIMKFMGIPLIKPFQTLHPGKEDMLVKTYKEYNEEKHDSSVGIFTGIYQTLEKLKREGIILGIVTSKRKALALRGMELFGIDKFMDVIIALEDTKIHKPEGEPVLKALEVLGLDSGEGVIYIGDSTYDILCGKNAGVKTAAVGWSLITHNELKEVKPDFFIDKPAELLKLI